MKTKNRKSIWHRLRNDRIYLICGFQKSGPIEFFLMTGIKAQEHSRIEVDSEYHLGSFNQFEIMDGHLPGFRPKVGEADALQFLRKNPWGQVHVLG